MAKFDPVGAYFQHVRFRRNFILQDIADTDYSFPMPTPRSIVLLLFEGVNALDVAGPLEAFSVARDASGDFAYQTQVWTLDALDVRSESGLRLLADCVAPQRPNADLLIVPGGRGVREPENLAQLAKWLRSENTRFSKIASVCTGAYALAEAGLVNGCRVATHWTYARDLQQKYPNVKVDAEALFCKDGRFYSSGGVTAGIDLALDIIESDHGQQVAMDVARELVVFLRRTGSQAQFSLPLRMQTAATGKLKDVCMWAAANLDADLSVEALASRAGLCERQFSRVFRDAMDMSPGAYIKMLRLDAARTLLNEKAGLAQVAAATGFASIDVFRRAFERQFGIAPREYRDRFCGKAKS